MPNELDPRVLANRLLALEEKYVTRESFNQLRQNVESVFKKHSLSSVNAQSIWDYVDNRVHKQDFEELQDLLKEILNLEVSEKK